MVRQPWYLTILYKIVKPFLKEKFRDRVSCGNAVAGGVGTGGGQMHEARAWSGAGHAPGLVVLSASTAPPFCMQVHMHGWDMESLYHFISQSRLPADFGGPLPPLCTSSIFQLFDGEISTS